MRVVAVVFALALGLATVASCRDNRLSESFDDSESELGYGGSGSAGRSPLPPEVWEAGAHGGNGNDHELLR